MAILMHLGAHAQALIAVTPSTLTHGTLDTLTLDVEISGVTGLFASSVTLEFNGAVIIPVGYVKGNFLEGNAGAYGVHYEASALTDPPSGTYTVDQTVMGASSSSGSGRLFSVRFVPRTGDEARVSVSFARLRDMDNQPISFTTEFSLVTINIAAVRVKAMLEGACIGGGMRTSITTLIPSAQPFNVPPWNYNGPEALRPGLFTDHPDIVDWVLVELRNDASAASVIGRRAALIRSNGTVVDTDGVGPVHVSAPHHSPYYIVVRHRNHLPVMSADVVWTDFNEDVYDFSTASAQAYGADPMKQIAAGVFGLIAGDGNDDGQITGTDYNYFYAAFFTIAEGYEQTDFNLDGQVTGTDYNYFYDNFFNLRVSGVPE